tara:strand:+ start:707 stop:868 length:162 start_codon:yes stop_codon:yes gene_type:complete
MELITPVRDCGGAAWQWLQRLAGPHERICRHREWTKFGTYSEQMLCRLLDDLC